MGKKKDKAKRKHDEARRAEMRFDIPPQVAGIAAMALKQIDTPAFKQMIAGALGAAAQAFEQRRPAAGPPPAPPVPPAPAAASAPQPHFAAADIKLPPEAERALNEAATQVTRAVETAATLATRALENAAAAMERWAAKQAPAAHGDPGEGAPPHG